MTARFHLQPLLDLANTRTDEAARKLGELVAAERDVEQKLKMLEDYRQEYNERFVQAALALTATSFLFQLVAMPLLLVLLLRVELWQVLGGH